ncbi:MAG: IclR family transcriptional regulator [Deltaproteobacteria bacterium]|nr:IclR family transcriptional regulator [Deltaproteobacteria bacterium]
MKQSSAHKTERLPPTGSEPRKPAYGSLVPAVEQASRILFQLAESSRPELSLTEICAAVGIHKSKGYAILNTLMDAGLVVRDADTKAYSLGLGLLFLSRAALDKTDLGRAAKPYLSELVAATQSTALLGIVNGERLFVAAKEEASAGIGITIRVGQRYPLTWGAHGKTILAFLPAEERERLLEDSELLFLGDAAGEPDLELVRKELERVRERGYGVDVGVMQAGIQAVSAPILGSRSRPVGCIVILGTFPPTSAEGYGERAAAVAREISSLLGPTLERIYGRSGPRHTD